MHDPLSLPAFHLLCPPSIPLVVAVFNVSRSVRTSDVTIWHELTVNFDRKKCREVCAMHVTLQCSPYAYRLPVKGVCTGVGCQQRNFLTWNG